MARTYAGFRLRKTKAGGPPSVRYFPLIAGTSYYEGQVLRISATTGSAGRQAAAGTTLLGVLACDVAQADLTSTPAAKYPVNLLDENNIFEATMIKSVIPQYRVGDLVDLAVASTHNYRVQGTASTKVLRIVGFSDTTTTTHANCKFLVQGYATIWAGSGKAPTG